MPVIRPRLAARGFFYRTHTGVEVDLLLELGGRRDPVEVKPGMAPPDTKGLRSCMETLGLPRGFVVNLSSTPVEIGRGIWMSGLREFLEDAGLRPRRP